MPATAPSIGFLAQEDSRLPPGHDTIGSLTRVVHELSTRVARRHPVTVVSTRRPGDVPEETSAGVRHLRLPPGIDRSLLVSYYRWRNRIGRRVGLGEEPYAASRAYCRGYVWRAGRLLARTQPALVHLQNVSQFVPPLRRALPDARLVLHMHCEWLVELPPAEVARRLAGVDLILGVSEHVVGQIARAYPALAGRCRLLPNGVDLATFPSREEVLAERGGAVAALRRRLGVSGPVLLYVGRLSSEKGIHVLLEAFSRLRLRHRGATCLLIGPDWGPLRRVRFEADACSRLDRDYVGHLRRLAAPHGSQVVFVGAVPNAELPLYHALADVLVAPSLLEAFGIPPIEAAASGLPVVASRAGGLTETVADGETGLLVPPGDASALAQALEAVLADPGRARALGRAGRARVAARFTWDRIAETLLGYYAELLRPQMKFANCASRSTHSFGMSASSPPNCLQ